MKITRSAARRKVCNIYWRDDEWYTSPRNCFDELSALWDRSDAKFQRNSHLIGGSSGGLWLNCPVELLTKVMAILNGDVIT